jgi:uncharacterized protein
MFDLKTSETIGFYVYCLLDENNSPFYIGKGKGNRVFSHSLAALESSVESDKLEQIRRIISIGKVVRHVILRWGMSEKEALEVESALIDFSELLTHGLTNIALGHGSTGRGLTTADDIIHQLNAQPLLALEHDCVIININRTRKRGASIEQVYQAVRGSWVISKQGRGKSKFALAEMNGLIVGVFKINDWVAEETNGGRSRWMFNGDVAPTEISSLYFGKSIAHVKKRGAANPIRYGL